VTIHGHQPGLHMAGNEILDNNIGRNNTVGDTIGLFPPARNHPDLRTTGILVGSSTHIAVVIAGNHVYHDYYGIYIDGFVRATFGGEPLPPGAHAGQVHLRFAGRGAAGCIRRPPRRCLSCVVPRADGASGRRMHARRTLRS
jgi:hypothetical protein